MYKSHFSAQSHRTPSNSHSQTSNHGSSRVFIQDSKRSQSRPIQSETQQRWHKVESTTPIYLTGASLKGEIKSELGHSKEDKELRQAISAILNNQAPNGVIIDDNWTKLLVLKRPGAINARSRCIFSRECRIERILPIQLYKLTVDKKYVDDLKSCLQYRPGLFWRGVAWRCSETAKASTAKPLVCTRMPRSTPKYEIEFSF